MLSLCSVALSAALAVTTAVVPTIPILPPIAPRTNGIVAAADGTVYFVDSFRNTVWRVQPGGAAAPFVSDRNGRSLQIDENGRIYGLHYDADGELTLWRADRDGTLSEVARPDVPQHHGHPFVIEDDALIGFSGTGRRSGVRLWRASGDDRYLVAGGRWGLRDGAAADARFFPIGAMTRTPGGELLVTSGPTVRRVDVHGNVTTVVSDERLLEPKHSFLARLIGDVQGHLTGIASGDHGEIYIANAARGTVVRINADGAAAVVATSTRGWSPTGVAVSAGVLYVLEYGPGARVRRITHDGAAHVLAHVKPQQPVVAATRIAVIGALTTGS